MLARISGDEFVLLVNPVRSHEELDGLMNRILATVKDPFVVKGASMRTSASIGVAICPDHGTDFETLRRNADAAMYRAKQSSRGRVAYFDTGIGKAAARKTEFERELRQAVDEGRFCGVLQPKVDIREMRVVGFEALARRVEDDGSLQTPAEFIGPATQLGLLAPITNRVVDTIAEVLPELDAAFGPQPISVNVSAGQATDPRAMRALLGRLSNVGEGRDFILELTEDAFLHAEIFQRQVAPMINEFGLGISIDDFGTGYASLTTLMELSATELKVDRGFVSRIQERPRAQAIVQLAAQAAERLGLEVVAEGVETVDELDYLVRRTPISVAQGYLFARPALPQDLIADHEPLLDEFARLSERASGGKVA